MPLVTPAPPAAGALFVETVAPPESTISIVADAIPPLALANVTLPETVTCPPPKLTYTDVGL
jgi:hypothetical protein